MTIIQAIVEKNQLSELKFLRERLQNEKESKKTMTTNNLTIMSHGRGGRREGAGRKPEHPSRRAVQLRFYVPPVLVSRVKAAVQKILQKENERLTARKKHIKLNSGNDKIE